MSARRWLRMEDAVGLQQLLESYPLSGVAASSMFPFLPPSLLGQPTAPAGATAGTLHHPLLGVPPPPVLRSPAADLLAQQYLAALAAVAAGLQSSGTPVSAPSVNVNDHTLNR